MHARKAALALCSLTSFFAHAQSPSPASDASPAVQSLPPVFVTGSPIGSNLFEMADPVNVLQGRALLLNLQATLGETLDREVGVASTYFGPNASRPVIRGLGGYDIRLLNNGLGLLDASAASPDHAVAVSPFAVERIEVVRGPATVMYGGSAIGGVVNTIDSRIAEASPARSMSGAATYLYNSASRLSAGGARVDGGNDRFALHADAYASRNSDLRIPGSAWTSEAQDARGDPGPSGRLPNSQGDSRTWGVGATAFLDNRGYLGVSYGRFDTNYGTVAEPDVSIELQQQAWNVAGELRNAVPGLSAMRLKYGYGDYTHTEFEGAEAGTVFTSRGWNLRLEALHDRVGPFDGAIGIEMAHADFSAQGEEAFMPSTETRSAAAFVYEEVRRDAWRLALGGRLESVKIDAQPFEAAGLPEDSVRFTPWSVAVGSFYTFGHGLGLGANLQYTQRAPSAQELFASGPHVATDQFEVGDRDLRKVSATSIDLAVRQEAKSFNAMLSAFYADFSNFVGLFPTGIWRGPDRSIVSGPEPYLDPETGEEVTPIQQFDYRQVKARFYGLEAQVSIPIVTDGANRCSIELQADYVRATDVDNDQPLPYVPPLRFGTTLTWQREGWTASLGGSFAARQDRVPAFQSVTPGYANVFANASYRWNVGPTATLEAFVQGTNLLDQTIRYSTSNLKDIAPAAARAVVAGVRGTF